MQGTDRGPAECQAAAAAAAWLTPLHGLLGSGAKGAIFVRLLSWAKWACIATLHELQITCDMPIHFGGQEALGANCWQLQHHPQGGFWHSALGYAHRLRLQGHPAQQEANDQKHVFPESVSDEVLLNKSCEIGGTKGPDPEVPPHHLKHHASALAAAGK